MSELAKVIEGKAKRPFYAPGWYRYLSNDDYHKSFGYSSSKIKVLAEKTPAHIPHLTVQATDALKLGAAVHTLVLEPDKFDQEFLVTPKIDRRTKAGKEAYEAIINNLDGRDALTEEDAKKAESMANSVKSHSIASILLEDIVPESSIFWWYKSLDDDGENYKLMAKVRPDAISKSHSVIIDLKTTDDASYTGFIRSVQKYYYHASAAMYMDGVNQCQELLKEMGHLAYTKFVFIVVEKKPPYLTAVYELSKEYIEMGKVIYRRCMKIINQDKERQSTGFPDDIRVIEPPPFANSLFIV